MQPLSPSDTPSSATCTSTDIVLMAVTEEGPIFVGTPGNSDRSAAIWALDDLSGKFFSGLNALIAVWAREFHTVVQLVRAQNGFGLERLADDALAQGGCRKVSLSSRRRMDVTMM